MVHLKIVLVLLMVQGIKSVQKYKAGGEFPFHMAIVKGDNDLYLKPCSGALIRENYVVTNARCVLAKSRYTAMNTGKDVFKSINVNEIYIHEKYNVGNKTNDEFDIAVVRLADKLAPTKVVNISKVQENYDNNIMIGYEFTHGGYQLFYWYVNVNKICSNIPMKNHSRVSSENCQLRTNYRAGNNVEYGHVILVTQSGKETLLLGLPTRGGDIFINVHEHIPWMEQKIKASAANDLAPGCILLVTLIIVFARNMYIFN